jgi:threonine dehydrogenase-like Zn-dependent dehydrogenase
MRQLTFVSRGRVEFREVPEPRLRSDEEAIVRPIASTTCDLDRAIIAGVTPFDGPFAIGHECVAEIVEVGDRVDRFAMYGLPLGGDLGGLFDDLVHVQFARALVPLPGGVRVETLASASDNLTDAYGAVAHSLRDRPGGRVLVLGGTGSIGQWAAGWAVVLGAGGVVYVDRDGDGRRDAAAYGADAVSDLAELTDGEPFDVLIDASGRATQLAEALAHVAPGGHCHSVGIYFAERTGLPLGLMYMNAISFSALTTTRRPKRLPKSPARRSSRDSGAFRFAGPAQNDRRILFARPRQCHSHADRLRSLLSRIRRDDIRRVAATAVTEVAVVRHEDDLLDDHQGSVRRTTAHCAWIRHCFEPSRCACL